MRRIKRFGWILRAGVLCLVALMLTGCAGSSAAKPAVPSPGFPMPAVGTHDAWWVYRFRIAWPPEEPPDFAVDLLLAHAVVKPSLEIFAKRLSYWRFHRRAVRDDTGHQFSLLFYTDPATAGELYASLQASPVLEEVRGQGLVTRLLMDDPNVPMRPGIADTSDPSWSPMLQRHWPAYIMGVSIMWLGLIDDAVSALPPDQRKDPDRLAVYRAADERLTALWFKEGQHALLHHLSAVFGYRELLIVKPMRF